MTRPAPPALGPGRVIWFRREGGLAHFPGLARPRLIVCARYSEAQCRELQQLLACLAQAGVHENGAPPGADRRQFHVSVKDENGALLWTLDVDEGWVPRELLTWWQRAVADTQEGQEDDVP